MASSKTKPFRFVENRPSRKPKSLSTRAPKLTDPQEQGPFFVRGIKAGSKEEYWVSLFLDKAEKEYGLHWAYQVPVYGGRELRGGNVIDFLLYTPGRWTMLDPKGRYWHTGIHEDENEMRNVAQRKNWKLIEWFTDQTPTKELMFQFLSDQLNLR